jgi:hypothetical protein
VDPYAESPESQRKEQYPGFNRDARSGFWQGLNEFLFSVSDWACLIRLIPCYFPPFYSMHATLVWKTKIVIATLVSTELVCWRAGCLRLPVAGNCAQSGEALTT